MGVDTRSRSKTGMLSTPISSSNTQNASETSVCTSSTAKQHEEEGSSLKMSCQKVCCGKGTCGITITDLSTAICCDYCHVWYHQICTDLNDASFIFMKSNPLKSIRWSCVGCINVVNLLNPVIKVDNKSQQTEQQQHDEEQQQVTQQHEEQTEQQQVEHQVAQQHEEKIEQPQQKDGIEESVTKTEFLHFIDFMKTEMKNLKDSLIKQPSTTISWPSISDTKSNEQKWRPTVSNQHVSTGVTITPEIDSKEMLAREKKKLNICLFNLPESECSDESNAYKEDMTNLKAILFDKEGFNPSHVKRAYRIGNKNQETRRPVVIQFSDATTRLNVLKMNDLKFTMQPDDNPINIYTDIDKTKMQVTEHKKLVEELMKRRETGEKDLVIRNNNIVKKMPFRPPPQTIWG